MSTTAAFTSATSRRPVGRRLALLALPLGLSAVFAAAPATAQRTQPAPPTPPARQGDWMVSANPLGLLYGGLTGEVERKFGGLRTIGLAVNYWGGYGGWNYLSADAKLRFYRRPAGTTVLITNTPAADFEGLSFGPMVGFQRVSYSSACAVLDDFEIDYSCSATGITAGGIVDYGVRFGSEKQFSGVAGAGVKTGFGFGDLAGGVRTTYPVIRLSVGYVFGRPR